MKDFLKIVIAQREREQEIDVLARAPASFKPRCKSCGNTLRGTRSHDDAPTQLCAVCEKA
jgi:hypothetical protein